MSDIIEQANALLALDADGALVPHGIGGRAREVITKLRGELIAVSEHRDMALEERDKARSALTAANMRSETLAKYATDWRTSCDAARAELAAARGAKAVGWLYYNPDTGIEFSAQHPARSGECEDAKNVREATADELLTELKLAWEVIEEKRRETAWVDERLNNTGAALYTTECERDDYELELRQAHAELAAERERHADTKADYVRRHHDACTAQMALDAALANIAKLREALEPFALMGVQLEYEESKGEGKWLGHEIHWIDCVEFNPSPTVGDLRRARAALTETGDKP